MSSARRSIHCSQYNAGRAADNCGRTLQGAVEVSDGNWKLIVPGRKTLAIVPSNQPNDADAINDRCLTNERPQEFDPGATADDYFGAGYPVPWSGTGPVFVPAPPLAPGVIW